MDILYSNLLDLNWQMLVMWAIGGILIYLAIAKEMEPTLLVFATTQPMDFTALWCAVCFGAATVACIVGFSKK